MPEVSYSTTAKLPVETIWEFVEDMDNWASFVAGYQSHEKRGERDSVWVLKGDVGVVTRTVQFEVQVEEWAAPERVRFRLHGVNEPMEGSGTFQLEPCRETGEAGDSPSPDAESRPKGWLGRLVAKLARFLFRLRHGRARRAASADSGPGTDTSKLTFQLRVDPGGPMGPMVNALMKPMMLPAAEDLANRIMATLEERAGLR